MRTIVYIDGYNLYYSRLQHTPYKWLDINKLFSTEICHQQDPRVEVISVKYFTSNVRENFASHGKDSVAAQNDYLRAVELVADNVTVFRSSHDVTKAHPPRYKKPPDLADRVYVWKIEEKQTDVDIATQMYRDVSKRGCSQVVLCSNDSDMEPPLRYIKEDFPEVKIGIVIPGREVLLRDRHRPVSQSLVKYADWVRAAISDTELERSQLLDRIPTRKKPIRKPSYW